MLTLLSPVVGSRLFAQEPAPAAKQTAATLKLRQINFSYRSSAAPLSCAAIRGRVAAILLTLGARRDIDVRVNGCDLVTLPEDPMDAWPAPAGAGQVVSDPWETSVDPRRPSSNRFRNRNRSGEREQSAFVSVRAMMPIEMTPEVLAEIQRDKSRRELVSRVNGNPAASLDDPIVFPAQRQVITLSHQTVGLESEECQLLEQMSASLFPRLDIRVVRKGSACDRASRVPPRISVEALVPVLPATPQLAPAAGESAPEASETESSESAPAARPE